MTNKEIKETLIDLYNIALMDKNSRDESKEAYDKIFEYLNRGKQSVDVNFTDGDIQDLRHGGSFDWTFPDQYGQNIDVCITQGDEEED